MAEDKISIELLIENANGARTVGELRKAIKDLKSEALGVEANSKEFVKLNQAAANAKEKIDDIGDSINALDSGKKFESFARLGGTIASGFQAAQGAAVLFGGESKELEKTLLKVQAATAFSQGIQGLSDVKKQFELLGNVIKANPILLIATVVTALGVALFALKDKIKIVGDAFDAMGRGIEWVKNKILAFTDTIGLTNTAADKAAEDLEKRFDRLIARGKEIDEQRERAKVYAEEQKKLREEEQKKHQEEIDKYVAREQYKLSQRQKLVAEDIAKKKEEDEAEKAREDAVDARFDERLKINTSKLSEARGREEAAAKKAIEDDKKIRDAKLSIGQSTVTGLTALGNILIKDQEKLSKFNKAAALVQIGVDTAKAISTTIASATTAAAAGGPAAPFLAAAYIAGGIATVLANMATAKKLLGDSGTLSAPTLGGSGDLGAASSQPRIQTSTSGVPETDIDPQTGKVKSQSIKVYVTETDITDSQNKVSKIQKAAILGG